MYKSILLILLIGAITMFGGQVLADAAAIADDEARLAENPDDIDLLLSVGKHYLEAARRGEKGATKMANKLLGHAIDLEPDNPRALLLAGGALIIKGRDATLPMMKMKHVNAGLELLDQVVALQPDDFAARFQRANNCANLPGIFNRSGTAVEDFRYLLGMARQAPEAVAPGYVTHIKLSLAKVLHNRGEKDQAQTLLTELIESPPTEDAVERARQLQTKLKG
ncbi:MAG: hypothetical protein GY835_02425 [bacterium]|nr:hypothetical protein [bacterium]